MYFFLNLIRYSSCNMATVINVCFLVLWLNLVLTFGRNIEISAVSNDDQQGADDIIIKLKQGGTTKDIENILKKHPRFKLNNQVWKCYILKKICNFVKHFKYLLHKVNVFAKVCMVEMRYFITQRQRINLKNKFVKK